MVRKGELSDMNRKHSRKGSEFKYRGKVKWVKGFITVKHKNVPNCVINNNLYGFDSYLNDGLKGCKVSHNSVLNGLYASLIDIKRGNYVNNQSHTRSCRRGS